MTSMTERVWRGALLVAASAVIATAGCGRNAETANLPKTAQSQPLHASLVPDPAALGQTPAPAPAAAAPKQNAAIPGDPEPPATSAPAAASAQSAAIPKSAAGHEGFPRPEDVPLAPMGETIGYSPVTRSPGYYPANDPEADAVRTGRRKAAKVDIPFVGGKSSPELLAEAILDALEARDFQGLMALGITGQEFADIMYQEFPESRPICNSDAATAYFFLDRTNHSGCTLGLTNWGGQDLQLVGIRYTIGRAPYTNFTLYRGVNIYVLGPNGEAGVIKFARTFAERNGTWKVYSYKDKE